MAQATASSRSQRWGGSRWALVLAAGEGSRLAHLTTDADGNAVPMQFCRLGSGASLLAETVRRATRVVARERITAVVASHHRQWWQRELAAFPAANIVEQPSNRGTAAGILLPLLAIAERDPEAGVLILPSDHYVADEAALAGALRSAFFALYLKPGSVFLLGVEPERAETELGWILPGKPSPASTREVLRFVEKPAPELAEELRAAGGLLNSFILVATARTLLELYAERQPQLLRQLARARDDERRGKAAAIAGAYQRLRPADFSRDLLQGSENRLLVAPAPACGWSDLGTPERLARSLAPLLAERGASPLAWPAAIARWLEAALAPEAHAEPALAL